MAPSLLGTSIEAGGARMAGPKTTSRGTHACQVGPPRAWGSCLRAGAVAAGLILATSRCGSSSNDSSPGLSGGFGGGSANTGGLPSGGGAGSSGGSFAESDAGGGIASLPPEMKAESVYQSPVATGNVVWIANPTSGRVAYIDAQTFDVKTVEAGDGPTYLAAVADPTDDVAIVLNVLSQDATLLRDHMGTLSA